MSAKEVYRRRHQGFQWLSSGVWHAAMSWPFPSLAVVISLPHASEHGQSTKPVDEA